MKAFLPLIGGILLALTTACSLRPPVSSEEQMIDSASLSQELAQGVTAAPFCLHLRYANVFYIAYSDTRTEAWVTEGRCASNGAQREVEALRLSWLHDWKDAQVTRQCLHTDGCRINEQHIVEGRNIRCAAAQARDGNQTAFATTNQAACH